jgi:hypothetical protein
MNNHNIESITLFDTTLLTEDELKTIDGGGDFSEDLGYAVGTVIGGVVCGVKCFVSWGGSLFSK